MVNDVKGSYIVQVIGPVVDVTFGGAYLPQIKEALRVNNNGRYEVMEVAKHIGNHVVRCITLDAVEGLCRDMEVEATGGYIKVPVGEATLGRLFNVLGEVIDGGEPVPEYAERWPIHRLARRLRSKAR
jgi:F-type H+-transporting ATPase subunit beta